MLCDEPLTRVSLTAHAQFQIWRDGRPAFRRAFDGACALAGLVVLAPILAAIAVAIKLDDGGTVFYCQDRVGKNLKMFRLHKFRTMRCGCAKEGLLTARHDARVTRIGRILRKSKLDELPQLVNVLTGEMQLVGVRPQVAKYVEARPHEYEELLQEPPGVTGLSSLCFRNEEELYQEGCSIEEQYLKKILPAKLQIALEYSRRRTFLSDLEIVFRTVFGLEAPSVPGRRVFASYGGPAPAKVAASRPLPSHGNYPIHRNDELDKILHRP